MRRPFGKSASWLWEPAPAGLEAARVARLRGHDVTILEKKSRVGGQINLIQKRAARSEMGAVIRYLEDAVGKLKVPVIRDTEATVENVQNWKPDARHCGDRVLSPIKAR